MRFWVMWSAWELLYNGYFGAAWAQSSYDAWRPPVRLILRDWMFEIPMCNSMIFLTLLCALCWLLGVLSSSSCDCNVKAEAIVRYSAVNQRESKRIQKVDKPIFM